MSALLTSSDLFDRARSGETDALDHLLRAHTDAITAVCRRRLRSRVDADDAVQETLLRAMGSLDAVREEQRLKSYLCRIAERVCLDMMRAGARPMPVQEEGHVDTPEALTLRKEEAELVRRTLMALSERQAQALWMRDAMGEGVPAVAQHLGVTEGSARVILARARKQMREGWAKAAAMLPGFGLKLPAPLAKLVTGSSIVPALLAPAAILIAAVLVIPDWGTVESVPQTIGEIPQLSQTGVGGEGAPAGAAALDPVAPAPGQPGTRSTAPGTAGGAPAATTPGRIGTIAGRDVTINREDPGNDDVTAGDEDLLGVGTSLTETLEQVGIEPPPTDLTMDVVGS